MRNLRKVFFFTFLCVSSTIIGSTQVFVSVTHVPDGDQVFAGQTVTISRAGSANTAGTFAVCGADPYWIGANYNGTPGSYSFAFSFPVTAVRFKLSAVNIGEVNSVYINGSHYPLTAGNLDSLTTCDTQYRHQLSVNAAGNAIYTGPMVTGSPFYGRFGSGMITIYYPSGIDSVRIHNNGVQGGSTIGFSFWGFPTEVTNKSGCSGDTLWLFAKPDLASPPTATFSWTGPNGFASNVQNPIIPNATPLNEGTYVVKINYGVNETIDSTTVILGDTPEKPKITGNTTVCKGAAVELKGSGSGTNLTYLWLGPGGFTATSQNITISNFQESDTGVYELYAALGGCKSEPERVRLAIAYPHIEEIEVSICEGDRYFFKGIEIAEAGVYRDSLKTVDGCDSVVTLKLQKYPSPEIELQYDGNRQYCVGDTLQIASGGFRSYSWSRDGQFFGEGANASLPLARTENRISLAVTDQYGCVDSTSVVIHARSCCELFIPNAFSPNADGQNDLFEIRTLTPVAEVMVQIFNRWGQLVFLSDKLNVSWDGRFEGREAELGTYFYFVEVECMAGNKTSYSGNVTLLR